MWNWPILIPTAYLCSAGRGRGRCVTVEEREIEGCCITSRGERLSLFKLEEHEETNSQASVLFKSELNKRVGTIT